ncbi:CAAD domain-containing protein [Nostoc sp. FACHB-152]|uniref:CAAD domain-containing protein n=1 Tax=unclassified Nostoc TaxID=2593658 RepID=UPI0016850412|nr:MULTISPECIES: CAAD domain-containing protein [unclassified Nostoc]MBD2449561.1 CAAD domain-containing protein [Nostoc sp. FACHB-152]MBD2470890.1 CAAD domain-containing protein [Nostoc sp. FACHB-145]
MALEQQKLESENVTPSTGTTALTGVDTENLPKLPPASQPENQWQQIIDKISQFLDQSPYYFNKFWAAYKLPVINFGLVLAAIITLKVVLTLLDVINDIPLLEPTLELIGIVYSTWFVFRYLLSASTRQELAAEIDSLRAQILGKEDL